MKTKIYILKGDRSPNRRGLWNWGRSNVRPLKKGDKASPEMKARAQKKPMGWDALVKELKKRGEDNLEIGVRYYYIATGELPSAEMLALERDSFLEEAQKIRRWVRDTGVRPRW